MRLVEQIDAVNETLCRIGCSELQVGSKYFSFLKVFLCVLSFWSFTVCPDCVMGFALDVQLDLEYGLSFLNHVY